VNAEQLCRQMIAVFSVIVPGSRRSEWISEWLAEVEYELLRGRSPGARLVVRCTGALLHALWLRKNEWRLEMLLQEFLQALRILRKRPSFTFVAVLVLALGIGANTAIFSVVYSVLWRSLPFKDPDRLVMVWNQNTHQSVFHNTVSPLDYKDYKEQNDVFSDLGEIVKWGFTLSGIGDAEPIFGFQVSSSFLTTIESSLSSGGISAPRKINRAAITSRW